LWPIASQAQESKQLQLLNVSYASVTGSRIPLWIAKEARLFEKYGLDVPLVVIAAGNTAISALVAGDVQVIAAPGSTSMASAARGLPVVIIGTFGPGSWKLVAHPSIGSAKELKGKTVGVSRTGTTIDFATRRALSKLGLVPGKDVQLVNTGLAESNKRILVMLQGKIDATLATPDNIDEIEAKGLKVRVLADLRSMGIYTTTSDLSTTRDFIRSHRDRVRAFLTAFCEAIWLGRTQRETALKAFRKYMREEEPKRLEVLYKNYVEDMVPPKPYPMEEVIQAEIENLSPTMPELQGKKPADFVDATILKEIESDGFFARLYK
jgi:NitT/TauT family transport system substrate-binding protein